MVKSNIVLSNPGDFTGDFYNKLSNKINSECDLKIDYKQDIKILSQTIKYLITNSKESIDIMAPFQTGIDADIISALKKSIINGVELRIITRYCNNGNGDLESDDFIKNHLKHFDHEQHDSSTGSIHAKVIISDKKEVYFGSGELMETSLNKNLEIGLLTNDQKIVRTLCLVFDSAWELSK